MEADELLELANARRPCARVTIYDEEGRILKRVTPPGTRSAYPE